MPDIIDEANERAMMECDSLNIEARLRAAAIPKGTAGICEECGNKSKRIVVGLCAPCRDDKKGGK